MTELILINGCGGAGKDTTGRKILKLVSQGAWIDIKSISRTQPWNFDDYQIGLKNAASVVRNFIDEKLSPIIFTGGIFTQDRLDCFERLLPNEVRIHFFWLNVDKAIRDTRRINRARDEGDQEIYLNQIDSVFTDPGELQVSQGKYFRIDANNSSPEEVARTVLSLSGISIFNGV